MEAEVLERVEHLRDRRRAVGLDQVEDHLVDVALLQRVVDELVPLRVVLVARAPSASARSMRSLKMIRPTVVRKCSWPARRYSAKSWSSTMLVLVGELGLLRGAEDVRPAAVRRFAGFELLVDRRQLLGVGP